MVILLGLSISLLGLCATLVFRPARQNVKVLGAGAEESGGRVNRNWRTLFEFSVALLVAGLIVLFLGFLMKVSAF